MELIPSESYKWTSTTVNQYAATTAFDDISVCRLPPATMAEASRRISRLYENIIFKEIEEPDEEDVITAEESKDDFIQGTFKRLSLSNLIHDDILHFR